MSDSEYFNKDDSMLTKVCLVLVTVCAFALIGIMLAY